MWPYLIIDKLMQTYNMKKSPTPALTFQKRPHTRLHKHFSYPKENIYKCLLKEKNSISL